MEDEWLTCPYDSAHRVPALRIQRHLVKCEKRHPPLAICPYNATHRVPTAQLEAHVAQCSTRQQLCPCPERARREPHGALAMPPQPRDYHWD